jgi:hypothetical protein
MKRTIRYIFILTMMLSLADAGAQGGGIILTGGVASSKMTDMKHLQEYILGTYPVEGQITSSFPPFTSISLTLYKQYYDYLRLGFSYIYSASGGKSSYQDYSGEIATEMTAASHRLGAYISYVILGGDLIDLSLSGRLDANYTTMLIESYYNIFSFRNGFSDKYWSISPGGSVGAELWYKLRRISLGMQAGYQVDLQGELKETGDGDPLQDPNDRKRTLTTDWSGWYAGISVLISFKE